MTNTPVICITGPESSGKSTLTHGLVAPLNAVTIEEYAREYLNSLPDTSNYTSKDLEKIACVQVGLLKTATEQDQAVLLDTGVEVIKIWHEVKFGSSSFLDELLKVQQSLITHYVLCAPDIPWEPDSLREHPKDRDRLFKLYQKLLDTLKPTPWFTVKGSNSDRISQVISFLKL